jgi:hypothetical protein
MSSDWSGRWCESKLFELTLCRFRLSRTWPDDLFEFPLLSLVRPFPSTLVHQRDQRC